MYFLLQTFRFFRDKCKKQKPLRKYANYGWGDSVNAELEPEAAAEGLPTAATGHSLVGSVSRGDYHGSEGGCLPTTEPIFPPSYCRSKAKNYTCFIVSSFQGILWIWNFICLVSIHCVFSLKLQLLSVSRLGKYAKIYPNAVIIVLHAMSGPTTGSWKNEGWEGLLTIKITLASAR